MKTLHAKTDSEATTVSSTQHAAYYVQSPSLDSHDGGKTTSHRSSPVISPIGSPPRSHRTHSGESSSTGFYGSLKPKSQILMSGSLPSKGPWKEFDSIEEEVLLDDGQFGRKSISRKYYLLAFFAGFAILFSLFSLILYGASRPQKPSITMKSVIFEQFVIQAGSDFTGVATEMVTMNSTVELIFRNTATFFGVHVTSTPWDLSYMQLGFGSGTMKKFYQSRKSQRAVKVTVTGSKIPLYGGGASLGSWTGTTTVPVPLKLRFTVRSRGSVLGRLVKPKFYDSVECSILMDPKKLNVAVSLQKSCTYRS